MAQVRAVTRGRTRTRRKNISDLQLPPAILNTPDGKGPKKIHGNRQVFFHPTELMAAGRSLVPIEISRFRLDKVKTEATAPVILSLLESLPGENIPIGDDKWIARGCGHIIAKNFPSGVCPDCVIKNGFKSGHCGWSIKSLPDWVKSYAILVNGADPTDSKDILDKCFNRYWMGSLRGNSPLHDYQIQFRLGLQDTIRERVVSAEIVLIVRLLSSQRRYEKLCEGMLSEDPDDDDPVSKRLAEIRITEKESLSKRIQLLQKGIDLARRARGELEKASCENAVTQRILSALQSIPTDPLPDLDDFQFAKPTVQLNPGILFLRAIKTRGSSERTEDNANDQDSGGNILMLTAQQLEPVDMSEFFISEAIETLRSPPRSSSPVLTPSSVQSQAIDLSSGKSDSRQLNSVHSNENDRESPETVQSVCDQSDSAPFRPSDFVQSPESNENDRESSETVSQAVEFDSGQVPNSNGEDVMSPSREIVPSTSPASVQSQAINQSIGQSKSPESNENDRESPETVSQAVEFDSGQVPSREIKVEPVTPEHDYQLGGSVQWIETRDVATMTERSGPEGSVRWRETRNVETMTEGAERKAAEILDYVWPEENAETFGRKDARNTPSVFLPRQESEEKKTKFSKWSKYTHLVENKEASEYIFSDILNDLDPRQAASMIFRKNSMSEQVKPVHYQSDHHPMFLQAVMIHDVQRDAFMRKHEYVPQVFVSANSDLCPGECEVTDGFGSCFPLECPDICADGCETHLDKNTYLSVSYLQETHALSLANMIGKVFGQIEEVLDAIMLIGNRRGTRMKFDQTHLELFELAMKIRHVADKGTSIAAELCQHKKHTLRDSITRNAPEPFRIGVCRQPFFQCDRLWEMNPEPCMTYAKFAEKHQIFPTPPDIIFASRAKLPRPHSASLQAIIHGNDAEARGKAAKKMRDFIRQLYEVDFGVDRIKWLPRYAPVTDVSVEQAEMDREDAMDQRAQEIEYQQEQLDETSESFIDDSELNVSLNTVASPEHSPERIAEREIKMLVGESQQDPDVDVNDDNFDDRPIPTWNEALDKTGDTRAAKALIADAVSFNQVQEQKRRAKAAGKVYRARTAKQLPPDYYNTELSKNPVERIRQDLFVQANRKANLYRPAAAEVRFRVEIDDAFVPEKPHTTASSSSVACTSSSTSETTSTTSTGTVTQTLATSATSTSSTLPTNWIGELVAQAGANTKFKRMPDDRDPTGPNVIVSASEDELTSDPDTAESDAYTQPSTSEDEEGNAKGIIGNRKRKAKSKGEAPKQKKKSPSKPRK